jgi:hypothetical protein
MILAFTDEVRPACLAQYAGNDRDETARAEVGWLWRG